MMFRPGPLRCGYPKLFGCGKMAPCPKHTTPDVIAAQEAYARLVQRAEYANRAAVLVDTMHREMSLTDNQYRQLRDVIRAEMETVAEKMRDYGTPLRTMIYLLRENGEKSNGHGD